MKIQDALKKSSKIRLPSFTKDYYWKKIGSNFYTPNDTLAINDIADVESIVETAAQFTSLVMDENWTPIYPDIKINYKEVYDILFEQVNNYSICKTVLDKIYKVEE